MDELHGWTPHQRTTIEHEVLAVGITKVLVLRDSRPDAQPAGPAAVSERLALRLKLEMLSLGISVVRAIFG